MNVLWDFRLFSYGYAYRGIGRYTHTVATAILDVHPAMTIFIWGDKKAVPESFGRKNVHWIGYKGGSWKSSVITLPYLIIRHKIDLVHYWAALGPLHRIGLTPLSGPSIATVYDAGVETWDIPYLRHVRSTPYWAMQKLFFRRIDAVMAISYSTLDAVGTFLSLRNKYTGVVYPPIRFVASTPHGGIVREKYFITLGGGIHKNCRNVVDAFVQVQRKCPGYTLRILGVIDAKEENLVDLPAGVIHEPSMACYHEHLARCSGLIFCSFYEGLGLPPLEALQFGCPLLLSSISALRETCGNAALFVDPLSIRSIAGGIEALITDNRSWRESSQRGAAEYERKSRNAVTECLRLYGAVLNRSKLR
jgi:glycosyltransferase involved in cell wall biosynthesis